MAFTNIDSNRQQTRPAQNQSAGWTSTHSWVFLVIVAVGLAAILFQNRYFYLMPQGSATAYRVSKFFGSVQEFNPASGWVKARLSSSCAVSSTGVMQPPGATDQPGAPMNVPASATPGVVSPGGRPTETMALKEPPKPDEQPAKEEGKESASGQEAEPGNESATAPSAQPAETQQMSSEQAYQMFTKAFPDFGEAEFELAHEDLFPKWRKSSAQDGTWPQFLGLYKGFIAWWKAQGSPFDRSGEELWRDFMKSQKGE